MNDRPETLAMEIQKDWGIAEIAPEADLVDLLARRVYWLLQHDYARLVSGLYLLDVPEGRFREAQALASAEASARALAELILLREQEKLESRRRYRREQSTDVSAEAGDA